MKKLPNKSLIFVSGSEWDYSAAQAKVDNKAIFTIAANLVD